MKKTHQVTISIRSDKPCDKSHAIEMVKDSIHGTFYPFQYDDRDPGEFTIRSVRGTPIK